MQHKGKRVDFIVLGMLKSNDLERGTSTCQVPMFSFPSVIGILKIQDMLNISIWRRCGKIYGLKQGDIQT